MRLCALSVTQVYAISTFSLLSLCRLPYAPYLSCVLDLPSVPSVPSCLNLDAVLSLDLYFSPNYNYSREYFLSSYWRA